MFIRLCDELKAKNYLKARLISVYEQVVMFLLMIGHNCRNFLIQDAFQRFGRLRAVTFTRSHKHWLHFVNKMIKPSSFDETPPLNMTRRLVMVQRLYRCHWRDIYFSIIPVGKAIPYRSRRKKMSAPRLYGCVHSTCVSHVVWIGRFRPWLEDNYGSNKESKY